uniref:Uncharacterized protein n=1 Tax=Oryzias latipes TaxID=8090 RepID=A0A3P9HK59_ORYLA
FIEGSRPRYLEDLHSEAQEGLKIQQQQAKNCFLCLSGSTFKPSSPVKRSDGSKKRVRRTTIMGIPHQVHKELGLSRGSTFQPLGSTQLPSEGNQDQAGLVVIPTVDGGTPAVKKEGARVHLSELEVKAAHELASHEALVKILIPSSTLSPGATTPPQDWCKCAHSMWGPVMSISPQATYLSTIIPNAVLPASIEVIEIDRCCSRTCGSSVNHDSSVCAVSKNSLTSGDLSISPMVSGSSDGNCSHPGSSHDSALLPTSTSGSNWSESQSSQTITAKPSPASSEWADGGVQENQAALPCENQDFSHPHSPVDFTDSPGSNCVKAAEIRSECGAKDFTRCLSIMKTKQPPAPPRRTNSLHNNKIRKNSRIVVDIKDISNTASTEVKTSSEDAAKAETTKITLILPTTSNSVDSSSKESSSTSLNPVLTSSNQAGEPLLESSSSSPQKTPIDGEKFERTMSPSSGYSSQSGTPTLSPKGICPSSPNDQNKKPIKPERSMSRASSSAASPSSSLTSLSSGTSELVNPDVSINSLTVHHQGSSVPAKELECKNNLSSFRGEITAMLNIPPPPKVKAPSAPPPETWAHNRHSVELLCGPGPNVNRLAGILAPKQDIVETESKKMGQGTHENQTNTEKPVLEMSKNEANPDSLCVRNLQGTIKEQVGEECPGTEKTDEDTQTGKSCSPVLKEPQNQETMLRKEPPPVMKKPLVMPHRKETELSFVVYCGEGGSSGSIASSKNPVTVSPEMRDKNSKPTVQTLSVELPTMSKTSPPPTPPPPYHPTPPALRKTPPFIPTKESQELQEELSVVDSCWPPPPPPLEAESAFDRGVEVDFPPPPPPVLTDIVADILDSLLPTAVTDSKPQAAVEAFQCASEAFSPSAREDSTQTIEVSPPPVELPPASPVTKAGSPESVPPVIPDYSFPKQMPQKPDYQTSTDTQVNSERSDESAVPAVPLPPTDRLTHGVNFRRQSSGGYRDTRSKELLSRHKSVPIPKEDANIPLVTPSLLQMVRLRSVIPIQGPQNIPQKPIRKSLSLKSFPQTVKASSMTTSSSSSRLQEAIRMKTAAMSSNDGCDMYKSTASTASFIFSKSTKKVIIETSMEPQASLKQSLAAEFRQMSSQPIALLNGSIKVDKVPPPVAKKPAHGSMSPSHNSTSCSEKVKVKVEGNGTAGRVLGPTGGSLPATSKYLHLKDTHRFKKKGFWCF